MDYVNIMSFSSILIRYQNCKDSMLNIQPTDNCELLSFLDNACDFIRKSIFHMVPIIITLLFKDNYA